MRNRKIAVIVAAVVCLPFALAGCAEMPAPAAEDASPPAAPPMEDATAASGLPRGPVVGTYQLVGRNVKDESGAWVPVEDFNSLGVHHLQRHRAHGGQRHAARPGAVLRRRADA